MNTVWQKDRKFEKLWCWETKFEIRDLWIGLFINTDEVSKLRVAGEDFSIAGCCWHFYFCPLPCCVLHVYQKFLPARDSSYSA